MLTKQQRYIETKIYGHIEIMTIKLTFNGHFFYIIYAFLFGFNIFMVKLLTVLCQKPCYNEPCFEEIPLYIQKNMV